MSADPEIKGGPLDGLKRHQSLAQMMIAVMGYPPADVVAEMMEGDCGKPECPVHGIGGVLDIMGKPIKAKSRI